MLTQGLEAHGHGVLEFDENRKVDISQLKMAHELAFSAPTASNIQPLRTVFVSSDKYKRHLIEFLDPRWEKAVLTSAVVVIFCADMVYHRSMLKNLSKEYKDNPQFIFPAVSKAVHQQAAYSLMAFDSVGLDMSPIITEFDNSQIDKLFVNEPFNQPDPCCCCCPGFSQVLCCGPSLNKALRGEKSTKVKQFKHGSQTRRCCHNALCCDCCVCFNRCCDSSKSCETSCDCNKPKAKRGQHNHPHRSSPDCCTSSWGSCCAAMGTCCCSSANPLTCYGCCLKSRRQVHDTSTQEWRSNFIVCLGYSNVSTVTAEMNPQVVKGKKLVSESEFIHKQKSTNVGSVDNSNGKVYYNRGYDSEKTVVHYDQIDPKTKLKLVKSSIQSDLEADNHAMILLSKGGANLPPCMVYNYPITVDDATFTL